MGKQREVIAATRHLQLVRRGGWEYVERPNVTGIVVIVPVTRDGELVLIEQYRVPVDRPVIELPAGLAGDVPGTEGERLEAAARRELLEETGYRPAAATPVSRPALGGPYQRGGDLLPGPRRREGRGRRWRHIGIDRRAHGATGPGAQVAAAAGAGREGDRPEGLRRAVRIGSAAGLGRIIHGPVAAFARTRDVPAGYVPRSGERGYDKGSRHSRDRE